MPKLRVGIYGSCVSRDMIETVRGDVELVAYVARASLLSGGSDAAHHFAAAPSFDSAFQQRNFARDVHGDAIDDVLRAAESVDMLLWDLVDERHGVTEFDDGTIVTRSIELLGDDRFASTLERGQTLAFGPDEHFARWRDAAHTFVDELQRAKLAEKVLVLAPEWARTDTRGKAAPWSMGTSANQANRMYERYFAVLEARGLSVARVSETTSDPDHQWGNAPFHYTPDVYEQLQAAMQEHVSRR